METAPTSAVFICIIAFLTVSPSTALVAPSAKLLELQASLLAKVNTAMSLNPTDHTSVSGGDKHEFGSSTWFSEASPNYLTGVSSYQCKSTIGLDCWMGPSYDVPHSLLRIQECDDDTFNLSCDIIPRGATPIGSDPSQLEKYYGDDRIQWYKSAATLATSFLPPSSSFSKRLIASPINLQIGGLPFSDVERLANEHQDFFLTATQSAQQIPARLRGSFNLRDDKIRQFFYRGEIEELVAEFGDLGNVIAASQTGPVAEAYVGGGS